MRSVTKANFNSPATLAEMQEVLAEMKARQHVNRKIVQTHVEQFGNTRYIMTLGKLHGLAATALGVGSREIAKRLGVTIEHPTNLIDVGTKVFFPYFLGDDDAPATGTVGLVVAEQFPYVTVQVPEGGTLDFELREVRRFAGAEPTAEEAADYQAWCDQHNPAY